MLMDVTDLPKFDIITVKGKLSNYYNRDINLKANKILIRAGELHIGSPEIPYEGNALIQLNGTANET
jgi:uncharacterized membrane protein YcgQ (UPF0703/DUF1980 family)